MTMTDNDYYDLYVEKSADPADLLALGEDVIASQIRELNPDEPDPMGAAQAVLRVAREMA